MSRRGELLARLRSESFDLLVIGGGIVGAGIARDAAMRGLSVALIEQDDFAGGTSSKTSKLIHGGLRYLEQGRLRLVLESLRERRVLRTIAPELVRPVSLLIPVYAGNRRPRWKIAAGLRLYDLLARDRGLSRHRIYSARAALTQEPALNPDGLRGGGAYADCRMDDARLCLANVLQAGAFGAVCLNYAPVRGLLKREQRLCGALVEDAWTGARVEVAARLVVNATGPWSDALRRLSDAQAATRLAPTKGIHLVLPRLAQRALFFEARHDRRMLFLLPWGDEGTLVGTTESPVSDRLEALRAEPDEADYLLHEVNRLLPGARLDRASVTASFAGARPLLAFSGSATGASREHRLEVDRFGLLSVMGGKYTTFRAMAAQAVDLACAQLGSRARGLTHDVGLIEPASPVVLGRWASVTAGLAPELLARWLARYGAGACRLFALIEADPALARPVCPHHAETLAELACAMDEERACTVSDLLMRRTRIAFSACQGLDAMSQLGEMLQRTGRLSREQAAEQTEAYRRAMSESLAFRDARHAAGSQPREGPVVAAGARAPGVGGR